MKAPDARSVALTGGPVLLAIGKGNNPIPFEKAPDGVWTLTVGPLKPNMYVYRFLLDGVAIVDPNNTLTGFSDQPGYSTLVVHGDGPSYSMPNNQVVHRSDPKHTELTFPLFEKELRSEIIPLVDKTYSTQANPHGRALAGLSMGGRHAQLVGFKSLDFFASFGILSAGDPESETSTPEFLNDPAINKKVDYLFVGLGTYENQRTNRSVVFHQILEKHGIVHDYYIGGDGGHDWGTWRAHLNYMLPKLWRAKTAAKTTAARGR